MCLTDNRRWVFAFDIVTGNRVDYTICNIDDVDYHAWRYNMMGYNVKVMTYDEATEFARKEIDSKID